MALHFKILMSTFIMMFNIIMLYSQNIADKSVHKLIDRARAKFELPAVAVSLMSADSIYVQVVKGTRIHGTENLVEKNDYFHLGSCSKSVLALIAGKLIEEKRIQWNSGFFDLFPELKAMSHPQYQAITLEQLFLCKAGIQAFTSAEEEFPQIDPNAKNPQLEFARYLLQFEPSAKTSKEGTFEHLYSNASYTLAALMLEKASGKSYKELIEQYIAKELDLNVYIGFPNTYNPEQAWGHIISGKAIEKYAPDHEYKIPYLLRPAGDLSMPSGDFAKYVQINLRGLEGMDSFLLKETWQRIHFGFRGFSLGFANGHMAGHRYSGMDGSAGTFFCRAIIVPDSDLAFIIMTNAGSGTGEMKAIDWLTMKLIKKHYNWWWKFWM